MKVYGFKVVNHKLEVSMYGISTMRKLNGEWVPKMTKREKAAIFVKRTLYGIVDGFMNIVLDILNYIDYIKRS
jgi:hypothetical protein